MHVKNFRGMLNRVPRGWHLTGILKLEILLRWVTKMRSKCTRKPEVGYEGDIR